MKNKNIVFYGIGVILLFFAVFTKFRRGQTPQTEEKKETAVFADAGWDSVKLHNAITGFIISEAYGYDWTEVPGSTPVIHEGLIAGEIDIHTEVWTSLIPEYENDVKQHKIKELGINYDDDRQGFYVPRYLIEGNSARSIPALAPDLKKVEDLKKYPHLFEDTEAPGKGRIYGAVPGWAVDNIMFKKYKHYKLDDNFIYFRPGSDAALSAALISAYDKGLPIVSYYWEPTWLMGKYDFVLLEDKPYNEIDYAEGKTELAAVPVTVCMSNAFYNNHPDLAAFFARYKTSAALTSKALAYMQDTKADYNETARWFLREHPELIEQWLEPDKGAKVHKALKGNNQSGKKNRLYAFPFQIHINKDSIDTAIRDFSIKHDGFFGGIRKGLTSFVNAIEFLLDCLPWWFTVICVSSVLFKLRKKMPSSILYGVLLFFIGAFGLWDMMNQTLAIVIASVIVSLVVGFPLGILIAGNNRAYAVIRPVLDTMQTMPVFVYLIPALLFFGLGKASAVIATTIYATVPMIRMTCHGLRRIDTEVLEAAKAFGSTKLQSLIKIQIPQALPTIMAGINQTIMMTMAMVVTTSMIGARGLGMEVLISVNRVEIGRGLISGTAVVIVAIILDRITQALAKHSEGDIR